MEAGLRPLLRGSAAYVPALGVMLLVGAAMVARRHAAAPFVLAAGAVFCLSLTLRTLDLPLCGRVPVGTHFWWHLLNAVTLGLLLFALEGRRLAAHDWRR
jgi:hypothetical protein